MRHREPFDRADLLELDDRLYRQADAVVAMEDIADGNTQAGVIGLRHDVDNEIESAVAMAWWEYERGIRATYFIEHTAPYWHDKRLLGRSVKEIASRGHEIGFHVNAVAEALRSGGDPVSIAESALEELRGFGVEVRGVVAHGDPLCHQHGFVNDEMFVESRRPDYGAADREIAAGVRLRPVSRAELGLEYDPNWLSRSRYLSDSGGRWSEPFEDVADGFPFAGQLHMLVHPCWWASAFQAERVAA